MFGELPASTSLHKDLIPLIEKLIELLRSSGGIHKFVQVLINITWGGGGGLSASGGVKVKKYTNLYRCSVI